LSIFYKLKNIGKIQKEIAAKSATLVALYEEWGGVGWGGVGDDSHNGNLIALSTLGNKTLTAWQFYFCFMAQDSRTWLAVILAKILTM
jgi:hypothetical protein